MKQSTIHDIAIIGGGIVGTATAMTLAQRCPDKSLVLLEAEAELAAHQSGRNSGVIHSGIYYSPGSLKAKNCVSGRDALFRFCEERGIPSERCGKVIVAVDESEIPALDKLQQRGRENGLRNLRILTADELKEFEPHASGVAALFVPETGIVDFAEVTRAYAWIFQEAQNEIRLNCRVSGCMPEAGNLILETEQGAVRCKFLINCAGLQCDRVARLCGIEPDVRIIPFRGEYFELTDEKKSLVKNLIYPVPDPRFPFLGAHLTRRIEGHVEAGPNAVLAFKREGYRKIDFAMPDVWETIAYSGFWKMGMKYWARGLQEFYHSINKGAFVRAVQRLVPEIQPDDLEFSGTGVRAQAVSLDGELLDDFHILQTENMIHVLNAPSPAATASLSIADTISDRYQAS